MPYRRSQKEPQPYCEPRAPEKRVPRRSGVGRQGGMAPDYSKHAKAADAYKTPHRSDQSASEQGRRSAV